MSLQTAIKRPVTPGLRFSTALNSRRSAVVPRATDVNSTSGLKLGSVELPTPLGIGCWSWGNTAFWNESWGPEDEASARAAFGAAMQNDIVFFDTAEAYNGPENANSFGGFAQGSASSEVLLGKMIREQTTEGSRPPMICTKFAALPYRLGPGAVVDALKASLDRLQLESVDAYMIHWPGIWQNDEYAEGLGDIVELGLAKCVGVSNHNEAQMRNAHAILAKRSIPLAFNQLQYSLTYNNPEKNGMLDAIKELDMVLMAYSPIQNGLLTGKYSSSKLPLGPRAQLFGPILAEIDPLLATIREVGDAHGGKSCTQVSLNYLIAQGNVLPIPGAKSAAQAEEFAGALGWTISEEESAALRRAADDMRKAVNDKNLPVRIVNELLLQAQV